ncbi:MAG: recombination mediator RecR [Campylobacterota bacterium]|nr:recombination mediator RecR [Campylobacterota bacterium]
MNKGLEKFYDLVESFEMLPSIGKKSALRLAYHIVTENSYAGMRLSHSIETAINNIKICSSCFSISENEICEICLDCDREDDVLCIVQNAKDIFSIEESKQYSGKYFVIEKLDDELISKLVHRVANKKIKNILFAITPSLANDAFILYIEDRLSDFDIRFTKIAQGVPTGVSLENVDILSLSKAINGQIQI